MTQDLTKGKIYKITNDYNDDIYVGSTCDLLTKRFSSHKKCLNKQEMNHRPLYKLMNEIGFERFRIQLIEEYPCEDKYQLRQREGHFIREIGTLNMVVAGRKYKEYYEENKEAIKERNKDYNKQYIEEHKDIIAEKKSVYDKQRRINEESFVCECGGKCFKDKKNRHFQSKMHKNYLENNNEK